MRRGIATDFEIQRFLVRSWPDNFTKVGSFNVYGSSVVAAVADFPNGPLADKASVTTMFSEDIESPGGPLSNTYCVLTSSSNVTTGCSADTEGSSWIYGATGTNGSITPLINIDEGDFDAFKMALFAGDQESNILGLDTGFYFSDFSSLTFNMPP